ncbi:hypothetical protein J3A83DRAFT_4088126 [Scleroderma citrinum]
MSVSIDDLVASLSSSHVGQEALDLVALQSQLKQSLITHQFSSHTIARRDPGHVQHCTTPTARTPSSSYVRPLPASDYSHSRRSSISSVRMRHHTQDDPMYLDDMDEEDALAVEAMIIPTDSGTLCASPSAPHASLHMWTQHPTKDVYNVQMTSPVDTSLFTTTDPFYIQASQNEQHYPASGGATSFFAIAGRPNAHSPFVMGTPAWQR